MESGHPPMKRMLKLTVRVRNSDTHLGKSVSDLLIDLYRKSGISGATVLQGIRGYGARGASRIDVLGMSANLPLVIETIDEYQKIEAVLTSVRTIVGNNGLVTLEEVNAF